MACACRRFSATEVPRIIRIADCPPVPWKNGAGTTQELWALRDDAGASLVRISIAEIRGAQVFSSFPETDRVILQLDGPPMVLSVDGTAFPLAALVPLAFAGEAQVTCALQEERPAHDLNLMCKRGHYLPAMHRVETAPATTMEIGAPGAITALLALGPATLSLPRATRLQAHDLILAEEPFRVQTAERAAFICLSARPQERRP
jgi:uncharacterized protein